MLVKKVIRGLTNYIYTVFSLNDNQNCDNSNSQNFKRSHLLKCLEIQKIMNVLKDLNKKNIILKILRKYL